MIYSPMVVQQARQQSEHETNNSKRNAAIDAEDVYVTYEDGTEAVALFCR